MQNNQPKFLTKDELRSAAMRELNVSKLSFDIGWIMAIEDTGRQDWYELLRHRSRTRNYVVGFRSEADMPRVSGACRSDDNDPNRTSTALAQGLTMVQSL